MKNLVYVFTIVIFIAVSIPGASARVIGGNDLENSVVLYYFRFLTNSGHVRDYSGNGLHGRLSEGAYLDTVSGRSCLSLDRNSAKFQVWNDNKPLSLSREFSIVAWVRIPQQRNGFLIEIYTYNGPIANIRHNIYAGSEGSITLGVLGDGALLGGYAYNNNAIPHYAESTDGHINNNRWQHIGLVVKDTSVRLYLNGIRIVSQFASGYQSLVGTGTLIWIGENARGSIDDVGFFKNDLTDAQVQMIYNQGLENIITIAPVDPGGKVATTWGALKQR